MGTDTAGTVVPVLSSQLQLMNDVLSCCAPVVSLASRTSCSSSEEDEGLPHRQEDPYHKF